MAAIDSTVQQEIFEQAVNYCYDIFGTDAPARVFPEALRHPEFLVYAIENNGLSKATISQLPFDSQSLQDYCNKYRVSNDFISHVANAYFGLVNYNSQN